MRTNTPEPRTHQLGTQPQPRVARRAHKSGNQPEQWLLTEKKRDIELEKKKEKEKEEYLEQGNIQAFISQLELFEKGRII